MSEAKANFATDTQVYRYDDGTEISFHIRVNFDDIVYALGRRARKSKLHRATALDGAIVVTARVTKEPATAAKKRPANDSEIPF